MAEHFDPCGLFPAAHDQGVATFGFQIHQIDEPLRDIADRFNRMNTMRLRVDDNEAGALRLTGNLRADDVASLRAFLEEQPALAVSVDAHEIRVRSQRSPAHGTD
ncbi:MAG: hypothetical protein IBJ08_03750 [Pseudomonas sp.]|nr:hypothetical protein [Pseudomonas sp.]